MPDSRRAAVEVRVLVDRPRLALLWLDTSILIQMTRVERGKAGADERIEQLLALIDSKRREGKLLCVESAQPREVAGHPAAAAIRKRLQTLTYGSVVRPRLECERFQICQAMQAYLSDSAEVILPARVFFDREPAERLRDAQKNGWWLYVDHEVPEEVRVRAKAAKRGTLEHLERIRLDNVRAGRGFLEQLARERSGFLAGHLAILERLMRELASPNPDYMTVAGGAPLLEHARTWAELGGQQEAMLDFFASGHYLSLPLCDISHKLYAQLLTIDRSVQPGDAMDISHMSEALPVAQWVLTDRSLENRVRGLGLDAAWGSKVFSLRSLGALMAELEAV